MQGLSIKLNVRKKDSRGGPRALALWERMLVRMCGGDSILNLATQFCAEDLSDEWNHLGITLTPSAVETIVAPKFAPFSPSAKAVIVNRR